MPFSRTACLLTTASSFALAGCTLTVGLHSLDRIAGQDAGTPGTGEGEGEGDPSASGSSSGSSVAAGGSGAFITSGTSASSGSPAYSGSLNGSSGSAGSSVSSGFSGSNAGNGATVASSGTASTSASGTTNSAASQGPLIAFYPFDESGGTTTSDQSGGGHSATLVGGATFSSGVVGNAVTLNGDGQYVNLPAGLTNGLTSFSIATWVYLNSAPTWMHIFDFGTGTNAYMALTPMTDQKTFRFSITVGGFFGEQRVDAPPLTTGSWQHVAVTLSGSTGILYVNGTAVGQNTRLSLSPASLGATTENWIGRSPYAPDPYLNGRLDEFEIYDEALTPAQVAVLAGKQ